MEDSMLWEQDEAGERYYNAETEEIVGRINAVLPDTFYAILRDRPIGSYRTRAAAKKAVVQASEA